MQAFFFWYPLIAASVLVVGCAVPPAADHTLPALPEQWHRVPTPQHSAPIRPSVSQHWWEQFGSPELSAVVEQALANNQDMAASAARLEQAWAMARMVGASRWPTVSASLDASRQDRVGGLAETVGTNFALGLTASYEVDLWGGLQAERESAVFSALASELDATTVALTVSAETATAWVTMQSLRQQLAIAVSDLDSAQRVSALVRARVQEGVESPLALAQQETLVANQRVSIALLRQQAAQAEALLALWLGTSTKPDSTAIDLMAMSVPTLEVGVPSELLVQRPDIKAAEARLLAADGNVAVARAAMLPSLRLSAKVGGVDDELSHVLANPVYSVAGGLLAPIFNAGRLAAGHDLAQAQRQQVLAQYRQAILHGFADVQMSLDAVAGTQQQWDAQNDVLSQANRAFSLAQARYKEGAETVLTLLDAQRSLYAAQDAMARRQAERLLAVVSLYRALGGGWQPEPSHRAAQEEKVQVLGNT
ncbi:efflux transporter outer membrane subunit [Paenalcaligenes sp. Me131]|uniref:efflux transporter outer membrane subunit n=1 Tax=Paenalcaligenes sp. Me131 TaxID=3392636 RepID=UPI003D2DBF93